MNKENLIIQLIEQDLKHNKLIKGLLELGLADGSFYDLDIFMMVHELMGIKNDELEDTFTDVYCRFMSEVNDIHILELDNKIPLMAHKCYGMLKSLVDIETGLNPKS